MIFKIDHIALALTRFDKSIQTLKEYGYEISFNASNLLDLENKIPYMGDFEGNLNMALMTRDDSISIELLDHGHTQKSQNYIFPVFEGFSNNTDHYIESFSYKNYTFHKVNNETFMSDIYLLNNSNLLSNRFNKLVIEVKNTKKSTHFWRSLGFEYQGTDCDVDELAFNPKFVGSPYYLYIRKADHFQTCFFLDSQGFNCLAFITSNAINERKKLMRQGIKCSDINHFDINEKALKIFWATGPNGENVEFISLS